MEHRIDITNFYASAGWYTLAMAMSADEMARRRWKDVSKKEHRQISSDAANTRWDQWRAENPEKAAKSEERRKKRAAAAKKKGKAGAK